MNGSAFSIHPQKVNADDNNNTAADESRTAKLTTHVSPLTNVFREAENSVVQTTSQSSATTHIIGQNGFIGQTPTIGSGIVYDLQGHIITNDHVIEGAKRIDVKVADGDTFAANLIGADSYTDLALLQIVRNSKQSSNEMLNPSPSSQSPLCSGQDS